MAIMESEMTKEIELKPCPFCGGEARLNDWGGEGFWEVVCHECKNRTRPTTSKATVIKAWNTRAPIKKTLIRDIAKKHGFDELTKEEKRAAFDVAAGK